MTEEPNNNMVITEEWRWRLLALWLLIFTLITAYSLFEVHLLANDNHDALCIIHHTHVADESALVQLMKQGGMNVEEIQNRIATEESTLHVLGCD